MWQSMMTFVRGVMACSKRSARSSRLGGGAGNFLPISTEAAFFSKIGRIPFIMPGTQELADAVVQAMGEGWAVLMQNHGVLVAGRTLRRTADMVEIIERTCEVIIGCYAVGKEPPTLPEDVVATLARYGDLMA